MAAFATKTRSNVVAEILMQNAADPGAFFVVEGPSDSRYWRPKLRNPDRIVIGESKECVLGAVVVLGSSHPGLALGVVDDDFDSLESRVLQCDSLQYTDLGDFEGLLLATGGLDAVLSEYGDPVSIQKFQAQEGVSILEALYSRCSCYGHVRWVNDRASLGINFRRAPIGKFIDPTGWSIDEAQLLGELGQLVQSPGPQSEAQMLSHLATLPTAPLGMVCQGHDLVVALSLGLRYVLGARQVRADQVSTVLRVGTPLSNLSSTLLVSGIRRWEATYVPLLA